MRISQINSQDFTGRYLMQFRDREAGNKASKKLLKTSQEKVTSIRTSDSEVLLLTDGDYDAYKQMCKLYEGDRPLLVRMLAHARIVESLKEGATIVDFKDNVFYV